MPPAAQQWIDMTVVGVRRTAGDDDDPEPQHTLILQERDGDRWLPIWIGPAEGAALALAMGSAEPPRPGTHRLAAGLVEAVGSRITEVRITGLTDSVFYAVVIAAGPDGPREVDARPSDAVTLALVAGAPIRADSQIVAQVSDAAARIAAELRAAAIERGADSGEPGQPG
jgi:uncharacterized protein